MPIQTPTPDEIFPLADAGETYEQFAARIEQEVYAALRNGTTRFEVTQGVIGDGVEWR